MRSFGIPSDEISRVALPLGFIIGFGGMVGNFAGGYLSDRMSLRDVRWALWIPAIANMLTVPFAAVAILSRDLYFSLFMYVLPLAFAYVYLGPTLSTMHALVKPRMRAMTSAVFFFMANLIGLGFGPTIVGAVSDALAPSYGTDSLRYAIVLTFVVNFWSAAHYWFASKHLTGELKEVSRIKKLAEDERDNRLA